MLVVWTAHRVATSPCHSIWTQSARCVWLRSLPPVGTVVFGIPTIDIGEESGTRHRARRVFRPLSCPSGPVLYTAPASFGGLIPAPNLCTASHSKSAGRPPPRTTSRSRRAHGRPRIRSFTLHLVLPRLLSKHDVRRNLTAAHGTGTNDNCLVSLGRYLNLVRPSLVL